MQVFQDPKGRLYVKDGGECGRTYWRHLGVDMFHGHAAALAVARTANQNAGRKVKRIIFAKGHFMVVDVRLSDEVDPPRVTLSTTSTPMRKTER